MHRRLILSPRILLLPVLLLSTATAVPGCTASHQQGLAERSPVIQPAAAFAVIGENDE